LKNARKLLESELEQFSSEKTAELETEVETLKFEKETAISDQRI